MIGPAMPAPRAATRLLALLPLVSLLCLGALPAHGDDWSDARKAFREALRSEDWRLRRQAYAALLDYDSADAVDEAFRAMAKEKNAAVLFGALDTLATFGTDEARSALVEVVRTSKGEKQQLALLALGGQPGETGKDVLLELVRGKDRALAGQAALALGRKLVKDALPDLLLLLKDKDWQLRAAGGRALTLLAGPLADPLPGTIIPRHQIPSWMDPKPILQALLESLAASPGSERRFLIEALERISGKDFGYDVGAWQALIEGQDPAQIARNPIYPPYAYGIPVYGLRVVVVMDSSVCTDDPHPYMDIDRLRELSKIPGARDVPWYEVRTTKQFMAAHTKRLIQDLPGEAKFDVVVAMQKITSFFGKLVTASTGNKNVAATDIDDLKVSNGIDTLGALEQALDVAGKKDSVAWSLGPDEVLYATCSVPWLAEETDQEVIGAHLAWKAGFRFVPMDMVGVGPHPYAMMKRIAQATGGRYQDLSK
jgi:hypothetical protein